MLLCLAGQGPESECCTQSNADKHHSADADCIFPFAVRTHLFPEVEPDRLPVVAYSGTLSMPQAEFQALLGPHIGETCSIDLCMRLRV